MEILYKINSECYKDGRFKLEREYGKTPNGNDMGGRWVLRKDKELIDFGCYRHDVAEKNSFILIKK